MFLGSRTGLSPLLGVVIVAGCLALSWLAVYPLGGAAYVAPNFFYVPILLAAVRFGAVGAAVVAIASTLLSGPLMPADVSAGTAQKTGDWVSRGGFFLVLGSFASYLAARAQKSWVARLRMTEREEELARQRVEMLQTLSHELRTPLTIILGTALTLRSRRMADEEAAPLLDSLARAARRLEDQVKVALAASGYLDRRRTCEKIDLAELTLEVARSLEETDQPRRVRFETRVSPPAVHSDPEVMAVILKCIIDNALKFSPPDLPVLVEVENGDGSIRISVQDRGPGIAPEFAEAAFQPFTQADASLTRAAGGLGIGLYAAHRLAEAIGGSIALSSSPSGTRLTIDIPQRREEDA
ncbi:MAG: sensor histidine kinase [Actinomycetota bacterium]